MGANERLGSPVESKGEDVTINNDQDRTSLDDDIISSEKAAQHSRPDTSGETDASTVEGPEESNAGEDADGQEDGGDVANTLSRATTRDEDYITGLRLILVILSVCLVMFLMLLDVSIVTTAIPRITTDFHSLPDVGWYGSAYLLANAALQPLAGKLYTYFNSKWIFLSFLGIFELGSLLCGVATSSKMLIVARAVAGMGGAGLMNGALTILSASVPLVRRPLVMGIGMGIGQMGVVIGPLIGGAFTTYTTWRWCFYINLPIGGLVALFLVLIHIPTKVQPRTISIFQTITTKLDLIGFILFAPSTIMFLLALEYGGDQYPWDSAMVIGLFCGSAGNFILFLIWEYFQGDEAMIPFSMVAHRAVWSSCLTIIFFFSMLQLVVYYLPIYFQAVKGASPMSSGVDMLPSILSQLLGAVSSGGAVTKLGYYLPFSIASTMIASVGHGLLSTLSPTSTTGAWIGYQVIVGFGRGIGLQMPFVAVQNTLPSKLVSISMSLLAFSQTLAGAVALTIGETIFTNSLKSQILKYAPGVSPEAVIEAGATGFRQLITDPAELAGVLLAYSKSVDRVFYLAIGCSCACFCCTWGMGMKDIRKKKPSKKAAV